VSDHRNRAEILVAKLGLTVRFANGSVAPSFVAGDVWQFACSASETVKALVPAVCADMDDYLNATYDLPLSAAAPNFVLKACELLRWYIIKQLGLAHDQSMAAYEPKEVTQWLANHQAGRMSRPKDLGITEKPPGTSFVYIPEPRSLSREFPI
jgi:phage gp36-like protein